MMLLSHQAVLVVIGSRSLCVFPKLNPSDVFAD